MTYRDLRNFTEMMRSLGYQRLISFDSFRKPNFPLVAEILVWLIKRFDPESLLEMDTSTEAERVAFIRAAAEFLAVKARVKLNTKWLYQADNYAVKELLKPTLLLYNAHKSNNSVKPPKEKDAGYTHAVQFEAKINDLKRAKDLSSRITSHGAALYELLGLEPKLKELRIPGATRSPDTADAEIALREALKSMRAEITRVEELTKEALVTASSLEAKVERKKQDLERGRKRLDALKKVRPAFLEEFQKLEGELQTLYAEYLYRHRSLAYLLQQEEESAAAEAERMEQTKMATRKMIEQMQKDNQGWDPLSLDTLANEEDEMGDMKPENQGVRSGIKGSSRKSRMSTGKGASRSSKISGSRNFGLAGEKIEDDDEEILDVEEDDRSESALESYSSDLHLDGGGDISDLDSIGDDDPEEELISRSKSQQQHGKMRSSANDDEF